MVMMNVEKGIFKNFQDECKKNNHDVEGSIRDLIAQYIWESKNGKLDYDYYTKKRK